MGMKNIWAKKSIMLQNFFSSSAFIRPFYLLSITLLSLLIPLSYLLLARLSSANYFLSMINDLPAENSSSFLFSIFLYTNPTLLHLLVAIITLSTLAHILTGRLTILNELPGPCFRPKLQLSWIFLCILQVCVGLGIEASIQAGIDGSFFGLDGHDKDGGVRIIVRRLIFFIGLHEAMLHWSRTIVKPIMDDTLYDQKPQEEKWVERLVVGCSFGGLSWWRLRDEVESLVAVVEAKLELVNSGDSLMVGFGDFVGWWLYYLTVTIGTARIIKAILWLSMVIFCRRAEVAINHNSEDDDDDYHFSYGVDYKV